MNTQPSPSQILLEWQSLDTHPHQRSMRWYLLGGIFILGFAAYGLFDDSWSTALVALLLGGVYFLMRNVKPRKRTVRITGIGIQIGDTTTLWSNCQDFWILLPDLPNHSPPDTPLPPPELHISPSKLTKGEIILFVQGIDPAHIRETMLSFLPERTGMEERFLDSLARLLKL